MPSRLNHLAAALGVDESISHALITRAITDRVPESQSLDWKQQLPTSDDKGAQEFGKDVAGFANGGGGVLVYGVAEDRATSEARAATPVPIDDGTVRQLRTRMNAWIDPPITGVTFTAHRAQPGDTEGFLTVEVPNSPDSPHFVGKPQQPASAPYRTGTQTTWMRERDVERAYRARFTREADDQQHLATLIDQARDHLDRSLTWLVAAAVPSTPLHGFIDTINDGDVNAVLDAATEVDVGTQLTGLDGLDTPTGANVNPRRGLRRWIYRAQDKQAPSALSTSVHVEIHHDGSIVLAEQEIVGDEAGTPIVSDNLISEFSADLVRLTQAVSGTAGHAGLTLIRAEITPPPDAPSGVAISIRSRSGARDTPPWTRHVNQPLPVHVAQARTETPDGCFAAAKTLADDIASQFGYPFDSFNWSRGRF